MDIVWSRAADTLFEILSATTSVLIALIPGAILVLLKFIC
jgi:hypothetical protein